MTKKWTKKKIIGLVAILLIAALVVSAIIQSRQSGNNTNNELVTEKLTRHSIVSSVSGTGTIMASSSEDVTTELYGYKVKEVYVHEGDMVSAGDIICTLDMSEVQEQKNDVVKAKNDAVNNKTTQDTNYDTQLSTSQADRSNRMAQAVASRDARKASYEQAKAEYDAYLAQYNAKKKAIIDDTTTSPFDKITNEAEAEAWLSVNGWGAQLAQYRTNLSTEQAAYENAEAQVAAISQENDQAISDAKTNYDSSQQDVIKNYNDTIKELDDTIAKGTIRATISGAVTSLNVEKGRTFNGGTVAVVEGLSEFYVEASIDEYDVADVSAGMAAVMKTDATRDEELNGYVTYVALKASGGSSSSGGIQDYTALLNGDMSALSGGMSSGNDANFKVKISLNDQNERLRLGMNVKVSIITQSAENVLAVPYGAIQTREDGSTYIEVIDEEKSVPDEKGNVTQVTKEIDVTVGLQGSYYYEIQGPDIKEGLQVVIPDDDSSQSMDELLNMVGNAGGV